MTILRGGVKQVGTIGQRGRVDLPVTVGQRGGVERRAAVEQLGGVEQRGPFRPCVATRLAGAIAVVVLLAGARPQTALAQPAAAKPSAAAGRETMSESGASMAPGQARTAPAPSAAGDAASTAVVEQPRPFGYVLGDTLTQRVLLANEFQPETLPPVERAGLWFTRRSSKLERADDNHRWLVMDYQVVNAPQALMTVNLPAVTLKSKVGEVLTVQVWPISVGPLTPQAVFAKGGLQELRPDHPAPMLSTSALQRQLVAWLTAFAITVAAWFAWWLVRTIRAAANQPFARALREVRQVGDESPDAWLALHRAFDRTAGRSLQTSTLPVFFKQAPHFESQRAAIEQFFSQSNLRFFGGTASRAGANAGRAGVAAAQADGAATTEPIGLRTLATTLRRIEKRHER